MERMPPIFYILSQLNYISDQKDFYTACYMEAGCLTFTPGYIVFYGIISEHCSTDISLAVKTRLDFETI